MSALVYAAVVGFLAGAVCMMPIRRRPSKARHARRDPLPKTARTAPMKPASHPPVLKSVGDALLLLCAKRVYAGPVGSSDPTPHDKTPHQLTSA